MCLHLIIWKKITSLEGIKYVDYFLISSWYYSSYAVSLYSQFGLPVWLFIYLWIFICFYNTQFDLPQLYWYVLMYYYKIFFNRNHPDTLVQFFSFILQVKIFKHILYCLKTAGWFEFEYKQCSCGEAISKTGYKGKTQRLMSLTMPCKFFTCFAYSKYALCFDNVYDDNQNGKDLSSSPHK